MKRLTMNQVARASLKANKKAYLSLAIGIFLAVYLASAMIQGIHCTLLANEKKLLSRVGYANAIMLCADEAVTDEKIRESGLFARAGKVFVTAQIGQTGLYAGYYDEDAAAILPRVPLEGRLPEKSGEIALELSAMEQLRQDLQVGDTVTWTMQPIQGTPEERTYTIVGVLDEQAVHMENRFGSFTTGQGGTPEWPNALLWPEDAAFSVGSPTMHRVLVYGAFTTYNQVVRFFQNYTAGFMPINRVRGEVWHSDPALDELQEHIGQSMVWWMLGGALLLSCGVGISSAMESVLAQKTEEIGMLRAVGATRRQIRRLFGRDAWLLVLAALPLGMILGLLTVWILSLLIPDSVAFGLDLRLLLPVAGLSALCVFLSSALPLRRASRQTPMGVLRDTGMLRKAKKFKSKKQFRPTQLIAGRQTRLHPLRQAGAAVMVALTLLCTVLLCEEVLFYHHQSPRADFEILPISGGWSINASGGLAFAQSPLKGNILSSQDLDQIRAIPQVGRAQMETTADAVLLFSEETVPAYFRDYYVSGQEMQEMYSMFGQEMYYEFHNAIRHFGGITGYASLGYLLEDTEERVTDLPEGYLNSNRLTFREMETALSAWGLTGKLVPLSVCTADLSDPSWKDAMESGEIDVDAIDEGRQIVAYAPNEYVWTTEWDGVTYYLSGAESSLSLYPNAPVLGGVKNDYFTPGKELTVLQALKSKSTALNARFSENQAVMDAYRSAYAGLQPQISHPAVGAVISRLPEGSGVMTTGACLITTEKGLRALGLTPTSPTCVSITLRDGVTEAEEETVQRQLERIAMRGGLEALNRRAASRAARQQDLNTALVLLGVIILFFTVSAAMQIGSVSRRIRADTRMIGTLRAVGADAGALMGCYRLPMIVSTAAGLLMAMALYLTMVVLDAVHLVSGSYHPAVILPIMAALAGLCLLCCLMGLKARLRQALNKSVVENIREL